jgi:hypothetical protein
MHIFLRKRDDASTKSGKNRLPSRSGTRGTGIVANKALRFSPGHTGGKNNKRLFQKSFDYRRKLFISFDFCDLVRFTADIACPT